MSALRTISTAITTEKNNIVFIVLHVIECPQVRGDCSPPFLRLRCQLFALPTLSTAGLFLFGFLFRLFLGFPFFEPFAELVESFAYRHQRGGEFDVIRALFYHMYHLLSMVLLYRLLLFLSILFLVIFIFFLLKIEIAEADFIRLDYSFQYRIYHTKRMTSSGVS